jgi:predicted AlkP superfamily pyrophosphatase or phosphodiesterase
MKRVFPLLICFLPAFAAQAQKPARPKLVVGIVVDQMRWDYLYKYYDRYGEGGFKRMIKEGFNCQNTMINYLPSYTGPGHACVYTGSVPSIHGIAANDWYDKDGKRMMYCTQDDSAQTTGSHSNQGKMSPANMLTSTITDELQLATNMRSRVYGIALKDRGSILPAGHTANGAFWYDDSTGRFITSSYYMQELPQWLVRFNNRRLADSLVNTPWTTLYNKKGYVNSTADDTPYEGLAPGESKPVFPHDFSKWKYYGLRFTPGGNIITTEAAIACMEGERLGRSNSTDFMCISYSSTDYAGHFYGPDAMEMEDMYLRMDIDMERLLQYLDERVGQGNYLMFLTADHGGAHNALYMQDHKLPAGNASGQNTKGELNTMLKQRFGKENVVKLVMNYQVYLDDDVIESAKLNRQDVKSSIISWLQKQEAVAYAADIEELGKALLPQPIYKMVVNGYHRSRSGDIQIILKPGWYSGHGTKTGTTHGSWNPYDSHIPLLWYGWHIPKGETWQRVNMTDISATLAALLYIQMPNGCIGEPILELVD